MSLLAEAHVQDEAIDEPIDEPSRALHLLFGKDAPEAHDAFEVHNLIQNGFPAEVLPSLLESMEFVHDKAAVARLLGMSERTLHRRLKHPEPLTMEQSSNAWRLAAVLSKAVDVFGDRREAERWLLSPVMGLDGHIPIELLTTQVGYELVDAFLTRIDYGVYV